MAHVGVRHGSDIVPLTLVDLSRSGALVNLGTRPRPSWLEVDADLVLAIAARETDTSVNIEGSVVRIVEDRRFRAFAVEFYKYDASTRQALETLLAHARIKRGGPPPLPNS